MTPAYRRKTGADHEKSGCESIQDDSTLRSGTEHKREPPMHVRWGLGGKHRARFGVHIAAH